MTVEDAMIPKGAMIHITSLGGKYNRRDISPHRGTLSSYTDFPLFSKGATVTWS